MLKVKNVKGSRVKRFNLTLLLFLFYNLVVRFVIFRFHLPNDFGIIFFNKLFSSYVFFLSLSFRFTWLFRFFFSVRWKRFQVLTLGKMNIKKIHWVLSEISSRIQRYVALLVTLEINTRLTKGNENIFQTLSIYFYYCIFYRCILIKF